MGEGFDFVAMGRALIADPDLIARMRARRGDALALHLLQQVRRRDGPRGGVRCVLDPPPVA